LQDEALLGVEAAEVGLAGELAVAELGPAVEARLPEVHRALELAVGEAQLAAGDDVLAAERALHRQPGRLDAVQVRAGDGQRPCELAGLAAERPVQGAAEEADVGLEGGAVELRLYQNAVLEDDRLLVRPAESEPLDAGVLDRLAGEEALHDLRGRHRRLLLA